MLPHAAELPHSENPSSAAPSLNALEGCPLTSWAAPSEVPEVSAATPEYGCKVRAPTSRAAPSAVGFAPDEVTVCTGCGVGPTLASLTDPVARHFVQVCHRAQHFRAKDELAEVLQVCHNFCATCVYQWSRLCMDAHIHAAGRRGKPLSGSLYFPVGVFESDSWEEADHVTSGTIGPVLKNWVTCCRSDPAQRLDMSMPTSKAGEAKVAQKKKARGGQCCGWLCFASCWDLASAETECSEQWHFLPEPVCWGLRQILGCRGPP